MVKKKKPTGRRPDKVGIRTHSKANFPFEVRLEAVKAIKKGGDPAKVAKLIGAGTESIKRWLESYDTDGAAGLRNKQPGRRSKKTKSEVTRKPILDAKQDHPEFGTRKIRDLLRRTDGLGVSEQQVRKILREEGLLGPPQAKHPVREKPIRRFERAQPNQLWQSDIFTFFLRRHERVYMAAFMDDHSRFLVSYALAHHQRAALVLEAIERGVADFGTPREVLTDQGRQYTAWRGHTDFEHWLRQQGIQHIKSRPQHPQTLGKIERFWKTLWEEFLSRTVFADFADLNRRLALFVHAYNFQRPHQALNGLVPADRYFRAAPEVRAAIEANVTDNARRLALEQRPRKPFYLVGKFGDRDLSIAAEGSKLRVKMGSDDAELIDLPKEQEDAEVQVARKFSAVEEDAQTEVAAEAEVAFNEQQHRSSRTTPLPDDSERLERRTSGDRSDRGGRNYARPLLPTRDARAERDTSGDDVEQRFEPRRNELERTFEEPRGQTFSRRTRQTPSREDAEFDAQVAPSWAHEASTWEGGEDLEESEETWAESEEDWFESGDEDEWNEDDDDAGEGEFDPDEGWRDRVVGWARKLVGERASLPDLRDKEGDGEEDEDGDFDEERLYSGARNTAGFDAALPGDTRRAGQNSDGSRRRAEPRNVEESLSDLDASRPSSAPRSDRAARSGTPGDIGDGAPTSRGERTAEEGQHASRGAGGDGGANLRSRERALERPDIDAQPVLEENSDDEPDNSGGGPE